MKIAIIGAGKVGASVAYSLVHRDFIKEIKLIDLNKDYADGIALDIAQGLPFNSNATVTVADYSNITDCDIVVITAGKPRTPDMTRLDLVEANSKIIKNICLECNKYNKDAIYLLVSNPLDITTYIASKYLETDKNKIFGTGTSLETYRYRYFIKDALDKKIELDSNIFSHLGLLDLKKDQIKYTNINAYILGEHGQTAFAYNSIAFVLFKDKKMFVNLNELFSKEELADLLEKTKLTAKDIIAKKGCTNYAIGKVTADIIANIQGSTKTIYPLSFIQNGEVALSKLYRLGRKGIKEDLLFEDTNLLNNSNNLYTFNTEEKRNYENSYSTLKKIVDTLNI